jgi:hypothetical protein
VTLQSIADERLRRQCITGTPMPSAPEAVRWLGAVQAQEYDAARSWHFVTPADIRWMLAGRGGHRDARRFFQSHGPATLRDFSWWSGLPMADGRWGLDALALLPIYDECLVAYRDREAVPHATTRGSAALLRVHRLAGRRRALAVQLPRHRADTRAGFCRARLHHRNI